MKTSSLRSSLTLIFFFLFSIFLAQPTKTVEPNATEPKFPEASAFAKSNMTYKIVNAPNNTYGYDIFADGRLLIHQSSIPGLPGNEGFKTKESAEKVAKLVTAKIKKGEMPPTVTKEEMQKLKAIK